LHGGEGELEVHVKEVLAHPAELKHHLHFDRVRVRVRKERSTYSRMPAPPIWIVRCDDGYTDGWMDGWMEVMMGRWIYR